MNPMNIESGRNPGWWPTELESGFYLSQHTSECCRCGPCQPNIDWVGGREAGMVSIPTQMQ